MNDEIRDGKDEKKGLNRFLGTNVFIKLKNGRNYSGVLQEIEDVGARLIFISLIDKYNKWITFSINEIEVIEEFREEKKK